MEELFRNIFSNELFVNILGSLAFLAIHSILTYAVYKWKGGPIACFYFFLAPVAIIVLIGALVISAMATGSSNSNTIRHDHYYH